MLKGFPPRPPLFCRKNSGQPESIITASEISVRNGSRNSSSKRLTATSKLRLPKRCDRVSGGQSVSLLKSALPVVCALYSAVSSCCHVE